MKNDFEGMLRFLKLQKTLGKIGLSLPKEIREKLAKRFLEKCFSKKSRGNVWAVSWDDNEIMLRITIQNGYAFFPIEEHNRSHNSKQIFINRLENLLSEFSSNSIFKVDGQQFNGPDELLKYLKGK